MRPNWCNLAALSLLLCAGPALAGEMQVTRSPYGEVRSLSVRVDDLNLASKAGNDELLSRIQLAAEQVCDAENQPRDLKLYELHRACMRNTMARTLASLRTPKLARLSASGKP